MIGMAEMQHLGERGALMCVAVQLRLQPTQDQRPFHLEVFWDTLLKSIMSNWNQIKHY